MADPDIIFRSTVRAPSFFLQSSAADLVEVRPERAELGEVDAAGVVRVEAPCCGAWGTRVTLDGQF